MRIAKLKSDIKSLRSVIEKEYVDQNTEKNLTELKQELVLEELSLKRKIADADWKKTFRAEKKQKLEVASEKYPELENVLKCREEKGFRYIKRKLI